MVARCFPIVIVNFIQAEVVGSIPIVGYCQDVRVFFVRFRTSWKTPQVLSMHDA